MLEPAEDCVGTEQLHARGRKLDGKRQALEAGADGGDRRRIGVGDREVGPDRHGPGNEEPDRLIGVQGGEIRRRVAAEASAIVAAEMPRVGRDREARNRELLLAGDPQRRS